MIDYKNYKVFLPQKISKSKVCPKNFTQPAVASEGMFLIMHHLSIYVIITNVKRSMF